MPIVLTLSTFYQVTSYQSPHQQNCQSMTTLLFTEFAVVVACQKMADLYLSCLMCFNLGTIRIYTCALKEREGKFKET